MKTYTASLSEQTKTLPQFSGGETDTLKGSGLPGRFNFESSQGRKHNPFRKLLASAKAIVVLMVIGLFFIGANKSLGAIAFKAVSSPAGTTTGTSLTVNKPAGVALDDVMVVVIAQTGNNATAPTSTGWTLIRGANLAGGTARYGAVLYKIALAGDVSATNYVFTLGTGTISAVGSIAAFSGVDVSGATPFDVAPLAISVQASQTGVVATTTTTATANAAVIMFGMAAGSAPTWSTWSSPSGLTEIIDAQSTTATVGAAWKIQGTTGNTTAGAATLSGAERNGGILVALKPITTLTYTSIATGNWNSPATWDRGAVPTAGSNAIIAATHTVTVDSYPNAVLNITVNNTGTLDLGTTAIAGSGAGTLTVASGGTLKVGDTNNFPTGFTINTLTGLVNYYMAGDQTVSGKIYTNLTLSGSGIKTITSSTVNGTLSMEESATATGTTTYGAAAGLQYKGSGAQTTGSEFPATWSGTLGVAIANTAGEVTLGGAKVINAPFSIGAGAILNTDASQNYALTFGGDFTKTGTFTANGSAITISSGTLTQSIAGFTTTGTVSMTKTAGVATLQSAVNGGALTINGAGGTLNLGTSLSHTFTGLWTMTAGTLNGGSSTLNIDGDTSGATATFTPGTGTVIFNGSGAQTIQPLTYINLTITNTGTIALSPSGTIGIAGTFSPGASVFTNTGSTINFNGSGPQTIPAFNYNNLTSSSTGARTLASSGTIGVAATFTPGTNVYTITGSTIDYNGAGAQTIAAITYNNLILSGGGAKTFPSAITINNDLQINSGATADLGTSLKHSALTLHFDTTLKGDGIWGSTGSTATFPDASFGATASGLLYVNTCIITGTWLGTTSTDWNVGSNWCGGVPTSATDVIIPSGTPNAPHIISVDATAKTITINSGATLTFDASNTLTVSGNWTNNGGTLSAGTGTVAFDATAAIGGSGSTTFNNLSTSGTGTVTTSVATAIAGDLTVGSGTTFTGGAQVITLTGSGKTITGTGTLSIPSLTLTGTSTLTGTLSVGTALAGAGGLTNSATGILNLGGNVTITTLTATAVGNTVNYNGAAQTAKVTTYDNLIISGSGAKTFATTPTVNGILSMEATGTITVTTGVVTYGAGAALQYNTATSRTAGAAEWISPFAGAGGIIISNTGAILMNGAKAVNATLTINSGATLNTGGTFNLNFGGNYVNNGGTLTAGASGIIISGAGVSQSIAGFTTTGTVQMVKGSGTATLTGAVSGGPFTMNGAGTLDMGTGLTHTFSGLWTRTNGTLLLNNSTLRLGNTVSGTGGTFTAGTGTVEYYASAPQTIGNLSYHNLKLSGTGAKTFPAAMTIANDLTILSSATAALGTFTHNAFTLHRDATLSATGVFGGSGSLAPGVTIDGTYFAAGTGAIYINTCVTGTWTGGTSTDWNDGTNWCGGVPGSGVDVIIPSGTTFQPHIISADASARTITINSGATLTVDASNSLTVSGNWTNNGTFTPGTGAVIFNATAAIGGTVTPATFHDLSTTTTGTLTPGVAVTVGNNLSIGDGTSLTMGAFALQVTGNTTVGGGASGTLTISSSTGAKSFDGNVTVGTGATWNNSGGAAISIGGNLSNSGTFTSGAGVYTLTGASKTIAGTLSIPSISITGSYTNNGTLTVTTALSGAGSLTQGVGSTLNINFTGTAGLATLDASTVTNTVNYGFAGVQGIISSGYSNLILSTSGVKTFATGTTISGDFSITGTASANLGATALAHGANTLTLGGVGKASGTWGSTTSAALHQDNTWFSGIGVVTVTVAGACTTGEWIGGTSTSWADASNWCNSIKPDASTNVLIPSGSANYPSVDEAAFCNNITVQAGASLSMSGTNTLTVSGNWSNNGTFVAGTGTVILNGTAQSVSGTTTFTNLTVSNSGVKTFSTVPTVSGILSMEGTATVSAAPTYGGAATLQYNATTRTAGAEWITPFISTGGVTLLATASVTANAAKVLNAGVTLTLNSGASLDMSTFLLTLNGNLVNSGATTSGSGGLTITGTAAQSIGAFTTTGLVSMTKASGTATLTGSLSGAGLTINGTAGILNLGTALTHNFSGTWTRTAGTLDGGSSTVNFTAGTAFSGTGGTFTANTGTVAYSLAGAQTAPALTYNNLTISGSGVKTFATTPSVNGILSMEGTATIVATTGVVTYGTNATLKYNTAIARSSSAEEWITPFAATGGIIIDNTGTITTDAAKTLSASVPLTLNAGSSLTLGAALTTTLGPLTVNTVSTLNMSTFLLTLGGNLVTTGTVSGTTGGVTISGAATQSIGSFTTTGTVTMSKTSGTATFTGPVSGGAFTLSGAGTLDLSSFTHSFSGAWTRTAGTLLGSTSTLNIGGTVTNTAGTFTPGTSTVNYNGAAQAIASVPYYNLVLSGTLAKTFPAAITISNDLTINTPATANLGTFTSTTPSLHRDATVDLTGLFGGTGALGATTIDPVYFAGATGLLNVGGVCTSTTWLGTTSDWFTPSNWSCGSVPTSTIDVTIPTTSNNPVITGAAVCKNLTINPTAAVTIGTTNSLTVNGNFANSGTFTANAGTLTVSGNVTSGTFNANTGTVILNGVAQTVSTNSTFNNLTLQGSGAVTFGITTINGTLSIENGIANTYGGSFGYGAAGKLQYNTTSPRTTSTEWPGTFTGTGGVVIMNTGVITLNSARVMGNNTNVPLDIQGGATLATGGFQLSFQGDFIKAGTLTAGSSPIVITGTTTAQNIAGFTTTGLVSMTKTGGTATFTGNVSGVGLTINGAGGTLNLGSGLTHTFSGVWTNQAGTLNGGSATLNLTNATPVTFTAGTFAAGTGTIQYSGAGQTVAALTPSYNNLTLSGTGTKVFAGPTTISNTFSILGVIADLGVFNHSTIDLYLDATHITSGIYGGTGSANATTIDPIYFAASTGSLYVNSTPSGIWTGAANDGGNWNTAGNWSGNILPTNLIDVTIPSSVTNWPTISLAGAVCRNININSSASLTISGTNTLSVAGSWTSTGTFTPGTGTVIFNGAAQTVNGGTTFYNLTNQSSAGLTFGTGVTTISGTYSVENAVVNTYTGSITYGANAALQYNAGASARTVGTEWPATFNALGGVIIKGSGAITLNGAKILGNSTNVVLNINSGATLATGGFGLTFHGNFVNAGGTLTAGASDITVAGTAAQSIAGFTTTGALVMTKTGGTASLTGAVNGGGLTINGTGGTLDLASFTHTFTGTWTRTAGTLLGSTSILNLNGSATGTGATFTAGTGLVNYTAAGAQTIAGVAYNNLTLLGSGAKTTTGATVNGILSMEGTATTAGTAATYGGSSTLQYKGSAAQTTGTEFSTPFNGTGGVIINNAAGITLNASKVIGSNLTLTAGVLNTSTFSVTAATVSRGTGWVNGTLTLPVATGVQTKTFDIGDATNYIPLTTSFTNVTVAGNLAAKTTAGGHPAIGTSSMNATKVVNRYWTLTVGGGLVFSAGTSTIALNWLAGDVPGAAAFGSFIVGKFTAPNWSFPSYGNRTATSLNIMGLTSFSDFVVGEVSGTVGTGIITAPGAGTFTVPVGVNNIQVYSWGGGGAGGGRLRNNFYAGGGGGGGGFQKAIITVTPGQVFNYTVGAGGIGNASTAGVVGGSTTFTGNGVTVTATGGGGGGLGQIPNTGNGGAAGTGSYSGAGITGPVTRLGGVGGKDTTPTPPATHDGNGTATGVGHGAGGGGGAGDLSDGGPGIGGATPAGGTGGIGSVAGYAGGGGSGSTNGTTPGSPGTSPGGGGGGVSDIIYAYQQLGGNGGNGQLAIVWDCVGVSPGTTGMTTPSTVCQGAGITGTFTSTGLSAGTYTITYTLSGANTGTFTVGLTMSAGGTGTFVTNPIPNAGSTTLAISTINCGSIELATSTFTVNAAPVPTFTLAPGASSCTGVPVTYTTQTGQSPYAWTIPGIAGTDYTIGSGGTSGSNTLTITWLTSRADTVSVNYTSSTTGCAAVSPAKAGTIVYSVPDAPTGPIVGTSAVCQGATNVKYKVPPINFATGYTWSYTGTGLGLTNPILTTGDSIVVNFSNTATSGNLTVWGTSSCGNGTASAVFPITVSALPLAPGTISGTSTLCQGTASVAYSIPTVSNATSYGWYYSGTGATFSDSTIINPLISFSASSTSGNLFVRGKNGCGNGAYSAAYPVTVNRVPIAGFSASSTTISSGTLVAFTDTTKNTPTSWVWSFPGGVPSSSTLQNPSVTYNNPGTYAVTLIATNACGTSTKTSSGNSDIIVNYPIFGTPGDYVFTVPPGVTSITVQVWGAGGAGGSGGTADAAKAGGGGGASTWQVLSVLPGEQYHYRVGAGGVPYGNVSTLPHPAGASYFGNPVEKDSTLAKVFAAAGHYGTSGIGNGGAGGLASASVPAVNAFNGGNGAANGGTSGGGGGGSAGGGGAGGIGGLPAGGLSGIASGSLYGGADGGAGGTSGTIGNLGKQPGGGGGGKGNLGSTSGGGGDGLVYITWSCVTVDVSDFSISASSACSGSSSTVTVTSATLADGTYNIYYNLSGANTATYIYSQLVFANHTGTFTTSILPNTGLTTITAKGVGCTLVPIGKTSDFTVNATPTITGTLTVCGTGTTQLSGSGTPNAITPWFSANTSVATVNSAGLVTGVSAGTSLITYSDNIGCTVTATVTVSTPTITGNLTVCGTGQSQLTGSGTPALTTPWVSASTGIATIDGNGLVTGVSAGTSLITYTDINGCSNTTTVTVSTSPTITGNLTVCGTGTTQLNGSGTAAVSTPWVSASTGVATISGTGLVTGVSAGTSLITYTDINGCSNTATVTVSTPPTITGNLTVCGTGSTQLSGSGTAAASTPWVSASTGIATVNGSGLVTGVSAGTSVITYTDNNGCSNTALVTVSTPPSISGTLSICGTGTTQLSGSGTPAASTPWVSASTLIATVDNAGLVTGVSAGTSDITYTNSTGCSIMATVTVTAVPTITISTAATCAPDLQSYSVSVTVSAGSVTSSAGGTIINVGNVFTIAGILTGVNSDLTVTDGNGCTSTLGVTAPDCNCSVVAAPTLVAPQVNQYYYCSGGTIPTISVTVPAGQTVDWFADQTGLIPLVSGTTSLTPTTAGTFYAQARITVSGCMSTTRTAVTITMNALPTITGTLGVCVGSTTQLTGSGNAASSTPWVSASTGVATVDNTGLVTGVSAGTSVITYTDDNGCSNTTTVTVNAAASITGTLSVCAGSTTQLTGSGTAASSTPWVSASTGIATVDNAGLVSGVSVGTSVITYTNSSGCSITATVTVNAAASITGTLNVCTGSSTQLTGSGTPASSTPWLSASTGVATVDNSGLVTGVTVGTSIITYTNSSGCSITATVTVNAAASITGTLSVCIGSSTQLTGSGTAASSSPWFSASTGVATVDNTGLVTGVSAGTSVITYTNSSGCSINATVTVNGLPVATATSNGPVCDAGSLTLTGGPAGMTGYAWAGPEGFISTSQSPTINPVNVTEAGTYILTVTNGNGCSSSASTDVVVNALPTFTITTPAACALNLLTYSLQVTVSSGNLTSTSGTVTNTSGNLWTISGITAGTNITLTVIDSNTCEATLDVTAPDCTCPVIAAPVSGGDKEYCTGSAVATITATVGVGETVDWFAGPSGGIALLTGNTSFTPSGGGTYYAETRNVVSSCKSTTRTPINVIMEPLPAAISGANVAICAGGSTQIGAAAVVGNTYSWTASPGTFTSAEANPTVSPAVTTTYTLVETVTSTGCTSSNSVTITVNTLPSITGTLIVCSGSTTQLTGSGTAASLNPWVSASTGVATVSNTGLVVGVSAGTSVITYTNNSGCSITATVTVNDAAAITGTLSVCVGSTTQLTGSGTAAVSTPWVSASTGVATVDITGLVTGVSAGTSVITYTNNSGCSITATVTVNAAASITGTLSVCIGSATQLTGSGIAAASIPWVSASTGVATVDNTGLVTGVSAGTSVITYTNNSGCSITATVTVNALPTITVSTAATCAPNLLTYSVSVTVSAGTVTSTAGTVANTGNIWTVSGVPTGTNIVLTVSSTCSNTLNVTAPNCSCPVVAAPVSGGNAQYCSGGAIPTITATVPALQTVDWYAAASGGTALLTGNINYTPASAGTYYAEARIIASGCLSTTRTAITITLNALPTITGTLAACVGSTTQLSGSGTPAVASPWLSASTGVATVSNTGLVTAISTGTSVITYTNSSGCSITATVTVNPAATITGTLNVCVGLTRQLTGSGAPAAAIPWVSASTGVATVSNTGLVTGVSAGTSIITYTNSSGCSITATVTVNALPTVAAITGTPVAIIGTTTQLANLTAGGVWSSSTPANATVNTTGLVTGVAVGTSTITYTVTNGSGCVNSVSQLVTVSAGGTLTIQANNIHKTYGSAIVGSVTTDVTLFTVSGLVGSDAVTGVTLGYGTGATAGSAAGTYSGSATVSTATGTITPAFYTAIVYVAGDLIVDPAPLTITANNVSKTYGDILTGAPGSTAFTSAGLVNSQTISTVTINYGTGAAATAAVGLYSGSVVPSAASGGTFTASNYAITYVNGNISVGQAGALTILANNKIKPYGDLLTGKSFSTEFSTVGLRANETVTGVTIAYGTGSAATDKVGNYTGAITISNAQGTFVAANYSSVTYMVGDISVVPRDLTITAKNKSKTYGQTITSPGAGSTDYGAVGLQNGETISSATITYGSGAAANSAARTYLGSVTISDAVFTFDPKNYAIVYEPGNIVVGKAPLTITANDKSKPFGTTLTSRSGVGPTEFTYTPLQNGEIITSVTMGYGPGGPATEPAGVYPGSIAPSAPTGVTFNAGNYLITPVYGTLTVVKGELTITADNKGKCFDGSVYSGGYSVTYSIVPSPGDVSGTIVYGGTGGTGTSVTAAGNYPIKPSGLSSEKYTIIYVDGKLSINALPTATVGSDQSICSGKSVTLGGSPLSGRSYSWTSLPAGFTSTQASPSVSPVVATTYTLVETNTATGCTNSNSVKVIVNPSLGAIAGADRTICVGASTTLGAPAVPGSVYSWTASSGGFTSSLANPTVTPSGTTAYTLTETNISGLACPNSHSVTVNVTPLPVPTILSSASATVCVNSSVTYTTESGKSGYLWTFSGGGVKTAGGTTVDNTITITWSTTGTQNVSVTYANSIGCDPGIPAVANLSVIASPANAGTITGSASVCAPSSGVVYSVPAIAGATSYIWSVSSVGATILTGQGTPSITVDFGPTATAGTISVYGKNDCSAGIASEYAFGLTQKTGSAGEIVNENDTHTFVLGGTGDYAVLPIDNATDYKWSLPAGVTITKGDHTNVVTLSFGQNAVAGSLIVVGSNSCGSGLESPQFMLEVPQKSFTIYPVPSNGSFTASITYPVESTFDIAIYDHLGHKITEVLDARTTLGSYKRFFDLGAIPNGIYYVEFYNGNFRNVCKLLINR